MDPLSITASVAGLVALADIVIDRTYKTIITCKNAGKDAQRLLEETTALVGILKALDNLGQNVSHHVQSQIPLAQVTRCRDSLLKMREKLDKASPTGQQVFVKIKRTLLWPITKAETEEFLDSLERYKTTFSLCLSVDVLNNVVDSSDEQGKLQDDVTSMGQSLSQLYCIAMDEEKRKILEAFGAFDAESAHYVNLGARQSGTGLWLLESAEFESWLNTRGSKLWCYGIPGAGKSVLAALAIQESLKAAGRSYAMLYYYCDYKRAESQNLNRILACLAGQLARQHKKCFEIVKESGLVSGDTGHKVIFAEASQLTTLVIKLVHCFNDVGIIVDGIDECDESSAITFALVELAAKMPSARMLLFSRDEAGIRLHLDNFEKMPIEARKADLQLFVATQLEERTRIGTLQVQNTALKDEILETLVNSADGMFRWVSCQLDHLCTLRTDRARRNALVSLPPNLNATYERILHRVNDQGVEAQDLLERTIHWLFAKFDQYTHFPLRAQDLCIAIAINEGDQDLDEDAVPDLNDILSIAGSLFRLSADRAYIEPAHFTVEEFLRSIVPEKQPSIARFKIDEDRTRDFCRSVALTYCSFPSFGTGYAHNEDELNANYDSDRLFFTLAGIWPAHHSVGSIVPTLWQPSHVKNFHRWAQMCVLKLMQDEYWRSLAFEGSVAIASICSPLHFASMFHMSDLIPGLLKRGYRINDVGPLGSVVQCAILGQEAANVAVGGAMHRSVYKLLTIKPIETCCGILHSLKNHGADLRQPVTIPGFETDDQSRTVQWLAFLRGSIGELVEEGVLIDALTIEQLKEDLESGTWTSLRDLPHHYFEPQALQLLTKVLFEKEKEREEALQTIFKDEEETTKKAEQETLIAALRYPDNPILPWLAKGFGINAAKFRFDNGDTLLHVAVNHGRHAVVEWLLKLGLDPNIKNNDNLTPLHVWAQASVGKRNLVGNPKASKEVLNVLLQNGADACVLDNEGDTFLHVCAREDPALVGACMGHRSFQSWKDNVEESLTSALISAARTLNRKGLRPWAYILANFTSLRKSLDDPKLITGKCWGLESALRLLIAACEESCTTEEAKLHPLHEVCALAELAATENVLKKSKKIDRFTPIVSGVLKICSDVDVENGGGLSCIDILVRNISVANTNALALLVNKWPQGKPYQNQPWAVPALCLAILSENEDLGHRLMDGGVSVNAKCKGEYKVAIGGISAVDLLSNQFCSSSFVSACLSRSGDPNDYNEDGLALIHILALSRREDRDQVLAEVLAKGTVDVNLPILREPFGDMTALMLAASQSNHSACKILVEAGADVMLATDTGMTALHYACQTDPLNLDIIQTLLAHGSKTSATTNDGTSPLYWVFRSTMTDGTTTANAVKAILKHSTSVEILDEPSITEFRYRRETNSVHLSHSLHYPAVYGTKKFPHSPLELAARSQDAEAYVAIRSDISAHPERWDAVDWSLMFSPLWIACAHGNVRLVKHLLADGADMDYEDPVEGLRCIHAAVVGRRHEAVRILLEMGCDILSKDKSRRTALGLALHLGEKDMSNLLQGYQLQASQQIAPTPAVSHSVKRPRSKLTDRMADTLAAAIERDDLDTVKSIHRMYYSGRFRLPCKQCEPFLMALALGKAEIAKVLVPFTIDLSNTVCATHTPRGYHAIHLVAAFPQHINTFYWNKGWRHPPFVELDKLPIHPLHIAAAHANCDAIGIFGDDESVNLQIPYTTHDPGWTFVNGAPCPALRSGTPLHVAIAAGREQFAYRLLTSTTVDVNTTNHLRQTPLHLAIQRNSEWLVDRLVHKGANVNASDISGTAITHSASRGLVRMLNMLPGADLSIRDVYGFSPMTLACKNGHLAFVAALLRRGVAFGRDFGRVSDYGLLVRSPRPGCAAFVLNLRIDADCEDLLWGWNDVSVKTLGRAIRSLSGERLVDYLGFRQLATRSTPLYFAAAHGQVQVIELLVRSGADVDAVGGPFGHALVAACVYGRPDAVKTLVRCGASLFVEDEKASRNFFRAARVHKDIFRWLFVERFMEQEKLCR